MSRKKIISIQRLTAEIDINKEFSNYRFALPEHPPIKLSNGKYLHTYRVTEYLDFEPAGDPDTEEEIRNIEIFG